MNVKLNFYSYFIVFHKFDISHQKLIKITIDSISIYKFTHIYWRELESTAIVFVELDTVLTEL